MTLFGLALLGALVLTQRYLIRLTNRRLNRGMVLATVFVLLNLLVDIFYAVLDPRIEYE